MVIVYKSASTKEVFFETALPEAFLNSSNSVTEKKRLREIDGVTLNHYELAFRNVVVSHSTMSLLKNTDLLVELDIPLVQMIFSINANSLYENYSGENDVFSFSPNQHNLLFSPSVHGKVNRLAAESAEHFEIYLHPDFLLKFLPEPEEFDPFRKALLQTQFALLSSYNMPVTAEMKALLKDIVNCQKNSSLKRLYVEAKIIELLMLQFEQYQQIAGNVICNTLRKADIQKMHQVRSIIDSNWKEPCSLINLAQMVTTNEYNLKKSFKEVFGTTIFGYLNELKMNEAKRLLLSGEMNIAEVADSIGYKNPNHFTTAFKKHFGYVPSELK